MQLATLSAGPACSRVTQRNITHTGYNVQTTSPGTNSFHIIPHPALLLGGGWVVGWGEVEREGQGRGVMSLSYVTCVLLYRCTVSVGGEGGGRRIRHLSQLWTPNTQNREFKHYSILRRRYLVIDRHLCWSGAWSWSEILKTLRPSSRPGSKGGF